MAPAAEDSAALAEVRAALGPLPPAGANPELLPEVLHRLNDQWGGLHHAHLVALAGLMKLPVGQVQAVAGAGHHFTLLKEGEQAPALTVRVCDSLACRMAGSRIVRLQLPALVGDEVACVPVSCLGRCDQAPAALVGQVAVPHASPEAVLNTLLQQGLRPAGEMGLASGAPDAIGYTTYRAQGGYALAMALANAPDGADQVLQAVAEAGLRGSTGAATATKWQAARACPAPRRMVVNLAQDEPGAFQDRACLEREPHRFLEGMLIAAQATGMASITIFLRDDFHDARVLLEGELLKLRSTPPFPLPLIELRRGECLVAGQPALVHNFDTLFGLRELLEKGAAWFNAHGRRERQGLRNIAVSGRVRSPGVKLAPAGISLRELVEEHCDGLPDDQALYAYLPGGAGGGILPAHLADLPLDFDTLEPYGASFRPGAVVVLGAGDRARDAALEAMRRIAADVFGRCGACRSAGSQAARLMEAPHWDQPALQNLFESLAAACTCGEGRMAPDALRCMQQYFAHEIG